MAPSAAPKTVLVADDTAFVRHRFKEAIESAGHRALTVRTASELLASVRADLASIDLLVIDLRLPQSTGVDVVRQIRKLDDGRLPILVFSGTVTSVEEVRELAALGVAGYVNEYSAIQHILPTLAPHIFAEQDNRRASPRVVVGMPIAYRYGNTIAAALTLNLSRGGVAVRTTSPLSRETKARLRFRLPGSNKDVDRDAIVRWSDARIGMGLEFDGPSPEDQRVIDDFVDAHFFRPRKT
jgi:CheY-like chemotaxis protein